MEAIGLSQDNPGITQPSCESQGITFVVVNILAYSVVLYAKFICTVCTVFYCTVPNKYKQTQSFSSAKPYDISVYIVFLLRL